MNGAKRGATGRTGKAGGRVPTPPKIKLQTLEDVRREALSTIQQTKAVLKMMSLDKSPKIVDGIQQFVGPVQRFDIEHAVECQR